MFKNHSTIWIMSKNKYILILSKMKVNESMSEFWIKEGRILN